MSTSFRSAVGLDDAVVCLVLNHEKNKHVRLGKMEYINETGMFVMKNGSVEFHETAQHEDGLFHTTTGVYALMSEYEYDEMYKNHNSETVCISGVENSNAIPEWLVEAESRLAPVPLPTNTAFFTRDKNTLFVAGNLAEEDQLQLFIEEIAEMASKQVERGNTVSLAFLSGSFESPRLASRLVGMAREGVYVKGKQIATANDVVLLSGPRELFWLRFANPDSKSRDITRFDDPDAFKILVRSSWCPDGSYDELNSNISSWKNSSEDGIAVLMCIKLAVLTNSTFPGVFGAFLNELKKKDTLTAYETLGSLINCKDIWGSTELLFDGDNLSEDGRCILNPCKRVVDAFLTHAACVVTEYLKRSSMVKYVSECEKSSNGIWLVTFESNDFYKSHEKMQTCDKMNLMHYANCRFKDFMERLANGVVNKAELEAYIGLSHVSGVEIPLSHTHDQKESLTTQRGFVITSALPFPTIQRRLLVDESSTVHQNGSDFVRVLEQWTTTAAPGTSTSWSVVSWCEDTTSELCHQQDCNLGIEPMSILLYNVSVTLASLLSIPVKGEHVVNDFGMQGLDGVIGSVVPSPGSDGDMRMVCFSHPEIDSRFIVLLPEKFVRFALDYYHYDYNRLESSNRPLLSTTAYIALPDEHAFQLYIPGISTTETELLRSDLGIRLWKLPCQQHELSPCDTMATTEIRDFPEGTNEMLIPGHRIFKVKQNSTDPFCGIHVGITSVPELGRVTIDTDLTKLHAKFRVRKHRNC